MKKISFNVLLLFLSILTFSNTIHANNLSYTDIGHGKTIILIHAFPTDQRLWKPQQDELKNYFRLITLDLMGFGQSQSVSGKAITMEDYADKIKELIDKLHVDKAIIGGESMGGYIALAFYEKYPNQVEGLILSDTQSIADSAEMKAKREVTAQDVLKHGSANFINNFIPKALSSNTSDETKIYLKNILEGQSQTAIASALRGMALRRDLSYLLKNSIIPILILTGDQDALISPQQSQFMHDLARNSKLFELTGAGHLSSLEQAQQWNKSVVDMFYKTNFKE